MNKAPIKLVKNAGLRSYKRPRATATWKQDSWCCGDGLDRWKNESVVTLPTGMVVEMESYGECGEPSTFATFLTTTQRGRRYWLRLDRGVFSKAQARSLAVEFADRVAKAAKEAKDGR